MCCSFCCGRVSSWTWVCCSTSRCPRAGPWRARGTRPPPRTQNPTPGASSTSISVSVVSLLVTCRPGLHVSFSAEKSASSEEVVTGTFSPSSSSSAASQPSLGSTFVSSFSLSENLTCQNKPLQFHQVGKPSKKKTAKLVVSECSKAVKKKVLKIPHLGLTGSLIINH